MFIYYKKSLYLFLVSNNRAKVLKSMNKIIFKITIFIFYLSAVASARGVNYSLIPNRNPKKLVVIDAGHGGHDSGAVGKSSKEKNLALQIALKLGQTIESQFPDIEVIYTRTEDVFLPLYQRIGIANKKKADLFISIHCNYISNPNTKGTETFVMGLHRADENLQVAKRENEVIYLENDYESNYEGYDPNSPVGNIILSSFQDAYLEKSLDFAARVEKNLASRGLSVSRGVKQAGFAVLRRATMPSVLIETGFISNEEEEKWLSSEEGQSKICVSISRALTSFFDEEKGYIVRESDEKKVSVQLTETQENEYLLNKERKEQFCVQIAALKNKIEDKILLDIEKIGKIRVVEENGYYKYQVGVYSSGNDANSAKLSLVKLGYGGAFVVKNKN